MRNVAAAMNMSSNNRSVTDIIWSCFATVFACTWVSLHPNIPHPDATEWHIRRHRFLMMLCGLIAPELIVLFALREWLGARTLVKRMKGAAHRVNITFMPSWATPIDKGITGFTMVHAHFMLMGGFMLHSDDGTRVGVIEDCNELVHLVRDYDVALPTTEEIRDRSKGDGLSKALVVGQCGWFMLQLLSRCLNDLAITEIELVTLAFAALNGVIYFLWWEKPLNVCYGAHVAPQEQKRGEFSFAIIVFRIG
jgi:hypothetical protein